MKKLIMLLFMVNLLSACAFLSPHKKEIEQGNIFTDQQIQALHTGMSVDAVERVMGSEPVMKNIFTPSLVAYVYTFQSGKVPFKEKAVICTFQNGRLIAVSVK